MHANLSPEYKANEAALRKVRQRLEYLREMLRAIPKHKEADHLQAHIKSRIKELSEEFEAPKKSGVVRCCQTVGDAARPVRKDLAHSLKYARV